MHRIRLAFSEFWAGFVDRSSFPHRPIEAWPEGYVPRNAPFPRITYQIGMPYMLESTILSASVWDRRQQTGFFGLVDDVLEQIGEAVPPGGIQIGGGALWIMRSNPFIAYLDDPDDPLITRGIVRFTVRAHGM